ncbi:MAG: AarF/UbiB family protein, partial [Pyrinomonadaceae bacterium]
MAAIEREEITHSYEANPDGRANGARLALVKPAGGGAAVNSGARSLPPAVEEGQESDDFEAQARSWRGWWRTFQIVRVLGTISLYLFLNDYDVRAAFNARIAARRLEEAKGRGRYQYFKAWARDLFLHRGLDKVVRFVRYFVYRGAEGSDSKERQLERQGVWLKENLIGLGPTFIKIGQALGTRADLLPLAYIKELALLQDQVPPFTNEEAFARVEAELGRTIAEAYAEFDSEPIASASLGQVYRALLHTGEEVAVKVQRPRLREKVGFDIAVLGRIVRRLSRYPSFTENADWEGMLREFRETISEEMDYAREGRNAERFRQNF